MNSYLFWSYYLVPNYNKNKNCYLVSKWSNQAVFIVPWCCSCCCCCCRYGGRLKCNRGCHCRPLEEWKEVNFSSAWRIDDGSIKLKQISCKFYAFCSIMKILNNLRYNTLEQLQFKLVGEIDTWWSDGLTRGVVDVVVEAADESFWQSWTSSSAPLKQLLTPSQTKAWLIQTEVPENKCNGNRLMWSLSCKSIFKTVKSLMIIIDNIS